MILPGFEPPRKASPEVENKGIIGPKIGTNVV